MERQDVDQKYKWNLKDLFSNSYEVEQELKNLKIKIEQIDSFVGTIANKLALKTYLNHIKSISLVLEKCYLYSNLNIDLDLSNSKAFELNELVENSYLIFQKKTSFFAPEIISCGNEYLESLIKDDNFKSYKKMFLDIFRSKDHILSKAEEELLSLIPVGHSEIHRKLTDLEFKFDDAVDSNGIKHAVNPSTYPLLMESQDAQLRESTYNSLYKTYGNFNETISQNYINSVKTDKFFSRSSKYENTLDQALFDSNLPSVMYQQLISQTELGIPLLQEYNKLRRKSLKLERYKNCDAYAKLGSTKKVYTFEEAIEIIKNALSPLGEDYLSLIDKAVNENWIDVFPTKNKRTGAYQTDCYTSHPFVLTDFMGSLSDINTLAHELGHAMHSVYSNKNNEYENAGYPIFLAEIASTTNEILLSKYLYSISTNEDEQLMILDQFLGNIKGSLFRQTMFSEFEDYAHKLVENGESISRDILNTKYEELIEKYHGASIDSDPFIKYEWSRIPHFYNAYYVFKYSTGLVSALAIANNILNKKPNALENYKVFLSSGGRDYPHEILLHAGVNLLTKDPYTSAFAEMKWALNEMENLIKNKNKNKNNVSEIKKCISKS